MYGCCAQAESTEAGGTTLQLLHSEKLELDDHIPYKRPDQNELHKQCCLDIYGVGMDP